MSDSSPTQLDEREEAFIGRTIEGRYRIVAPIATGGMGAVFQGEHLHMRKRLAIKILHAEIEGVLDLAEQFEREAIAGAHISHPNVAIATDFGRLDDGSFFLVLEYLRGRTLAEVLDDGPVTMERVVPIARQIAAALQAVHAKGIVHRDVKPGNVMLIQDTEDEAKLIDFGFAKVPMAQMSLAAADDPLHETDGHWDPDTVLGTIGYLAPEAAQGLDAIDGRSDLYALGVIMYEMFTGARPFEAPEVSELFRLHRTEPPPTFFERAPLVPVPAPYESVVMRLLAKDPGDRYQTGAEVIAALERADAGRARAEAPLPNVDLSDLELARPRRSLATWVAVVLVLLALGGVTAWLVPALGDQLRAWGVPIPKATAEAEAEPEKPAAPTEVDSLGAAAWTARLLTAPKAKDWQGGVRALTALAQLDPKALQATELAAAARAVASGAAGLPAENPAGAEVFDRLAHGFGSDGLDVLYAVTEKHPPEHPARERALEHLRQPDTLKQGTRQLRIAVELSEAPCEQKERLLHRAMADGDQRALNVLKRLRARPCKVPSDPCCFQKNAAFSRSISTLTARLKKRKK
ncbi:MAG: serine/threonine protein kinase [Deltaproteobacteria bacterium]|nr:serine/threonine protein kinase [Deltaproteobacteria bacterium]